MNCREVVVVVVVVADVAEVAEDEDGVLGDLVVILVYIFCSVGRNNSYADLMLPMMVILCLKQSLAALTKQTAKEMGMQRMPVIQESSKAFKPPKIVVCDETAGVREEIRKQPGQLPYMHRNPAV